MEDSKSAAHENTAAVDGAAKKRGYLSQSEHIYQIAYLFAICSFAYGLNAIFNSAFALTFFGFEYPTSDDSKRIIDALMIIYGMRDIYMGVAIAAAAYYRQSNVLGVLIIATGGIAVADGAVCYYIAGQGYWNHLPLSPAVFVVGAVFLGAFDRS